ncbi:MAG: lysylphosphatidylglycerol synthase transmembrane domain-containing protein [Smithellaceae bacterium]
MNKKIIIGLLLSIVLIYLSVRGIDFRETVTSLKNIAWGYALLALLVIFIMQALRSFRWGVILQPLEKIDQFTLFSVTCVGFLAIAAIPARLGELARPYLIARKSSIKMSSALGAVVVERVLDSLSVLIITVVVVIWHDLPPWLIKSAILFFILTLLMLLFIIVLIWRRNMAVSLIAWVLRRLPNKIAIRLDGLIHHFIDGFEVIKDVRMLLYLFFLSAVVWLVDVVAIYLLLVAFGFDLPLLAPFILMIVLIAGIAIPTAPGYIGNWHFACILGLSLFGVPASEALSFALVYHFLSIALVVVLGVIFLPFNKFSLSDMKKQMDQSEA